MIRTYAKLPMPFVRFSYQSAHTRGIRISQNVSLFEKWPLYCTSVNSTDEKKSNQKRLALSEFLIKKGYRIDMRCMLDLFKESIGAIIVKNNDEFQHHTRVFKAFGVRISINIIITPLKAKPRQSSYVSEAFQNVIIGKIVSESGLEIQNVKQTPAGKIAESILLENNIDPSVFCEKIVDLYHELNASAHASTNMPAFSLEEHQYFIDKTFCDEGKEVPYAIVKIIAKLDEAGLLKAIPPHTSAKTS